MLTKRSRSQMAQRTATMKVGMLQRNSDGHGDNGDSNDGDGADGRGGGEGGGGKEG
jgi:hypothetical protein